jgi:uroporphyrinogen decarboxylase
MTSPQRDRVAATLACKRADQLPLGELYVEDGLVAALAGQPPGQPVTPATRAKVLEALHFDAIAAYPSWRGHPLLGVHLADPSPGRDAGTLHPHTGTELGLPDPARLDWSPVRAARATSPFYVLAMLPGPFGELAYGLGMERFLLLCWREPAEAQRLGDAMVDYGLELARLALANGAQGLVVGEDIAWEGGLLLRASLYRSLFLPALEREVSGLRALGAPVVFHSDGDVRALLDDLVGTGIDALHGCATASEVAPSSLAARTKRRLCLWGSLDLAAFAVSEEVLTARVDEVFSAAPAWPGYIFGTSAGILDASLSVTAVRTAFDRAHAISAAGGLTRPQ